MALDSVQFARLANVSRETCERFRIYEQMLRRWQPAMNLVARSTLDDVWNRHFLDSAQIARIIPAAAASLLDIGSGAGFPGLVLAILGVKNVHLVESDQRKCQFLREVAHATSTEIRICNDRIERFPARPFDLVTARACAPLATLLDLAVPFLHEASVAIFPKGGRCQEELAGAETRWTMRYTVVPSMTDRSGQLVRVEGVPDATAKSE